MRAPDSQGQATGASGQGQAAAVRAQGTGEGGSRCAHLRMGQSLQLRKCCGHILLVVLFELCAKTRTRKLGCRAALRDAALYRSDRFALGRGRYHNLREV